MAGQSFEIPALPAATWLRVLMDDDATTDDIFLELVPGGTALLLDRGLDLVELAHEIIELVSGRIWYVALRLIVLVRHSWPVIGGSMLRAGIDAMQLSLAAWLDVALLTILENMDRKDHAMFAAQLENPPLGTEMPPEEMEMSHDEFLSMMR